MCSPGSFAASSQPGTVCATDLWDVRMCPQCPARGARRGFAAGQAPRDLPESGFSLWLRSAGGRSRGGCSLVTRAAVVPVCGVVMDMDKDMGREEVLHAGRAPADATCDIGEVQGRDGAEVAAVGVELAAHSPLNCVFSQVLVCYLLLSL